MLYGKSDAASNVSVVVTSTVQATQNTANRDALYGNTTSDAFVSGTKKGIFGVSAGEAQAARAGANTRYVSPGYQLRTVGSGGRAGRVQNETLVAVRITGTDASDDAVVPDYMITITSQPAANTGDASNNDAVTFTVVGASTPSGATLTYQWQRWNGSAFVNASGTGYVNPTTATLTLWANTVTDGEIVRCVVGATGATNANSSNAVLTVVA